MRKEIIAVTLCNFLFFAGCHAKVPKKVLSVGLDHPNATKANKQDTLNFSFTQAPAADKFLWFVNGSPCIDQNEKIRLTNGKASCHIKPDADEKTYCYGLTGSPDIKPHSCPGCEIIVGRPTGPPIGCSEGTPVP